MDLSSKPRAAPRVGVVVSCIEYTALVDSRAWVCVMSLVAVGKLSRLATLFKLVQVVSLPGIAWMTNDGMACGTAFPRKSVASLPVYLTFTTYSPHSLQSINKWKTSIHLGTTALP